MNTFQEIEKVSVRAPDNIRPKGISYGQLYGQTPTVTLKHKQSSSYFYNTGDGLFPTQPNLSQYNLVEEDLISSEISRRDKSYNGSPTNNQSLSHLDIMFRDISPKKNRKKSQEVGRLSKISQNSATKISRNSILEATINGDTIQGIQFD